MFPLFTSIRGCFILLLCQLTAATLWQVQLLLLVSRKFYKKEKKQTLDSHRIYQCLMMLSRKMNLSKGFNPAFYVALFFGHPAMTNQPYGALALNNMK